jgi:hypothetical protein
MPHTKAWSRTVVTISTSPIELKAEYAITRQQVNQLKSLLAGWTRSGPNTIDVPYLRADHIEIGLPPFSIAHLTMNSTLAVSTVWTSIPFTDIEWNTGIIDYSTVSTGTITFTAPPGGRAFMLFGNISWITGDNGRHSIKIEAYPSTEESIMTALEGGEAGQTFSGIFSPPEGTTAIELRVFPTTGNSVMFGELTILEVSRNYL